MDTINVAEARKEFASLMTRVAYNGERIIVERHGKPLMAWVSIEDLRRLEKLDQQQAAGSAEGERLLALAAELRRQILAGRGGLPLPDSAEMIRRLRDEH